MIPSEGIKTKTYIKIGYQMLYMRKQNYAKLKKLLQDDHRSNQQMQQRQGMNEQNSQLQSSKKVQINCQMSRQTDQNCTWSSIYKLKLSKNGGDKKQYQNQHQNNTNYLATFQFKWKSGERIQFINLQEKGFIKICNPITLQKSTQQQNKNNWLFFDTYTYVENYEEIAVQIWACQGFLQKLTQNYQIFEQKVKLDNNFEANEHRLTKLRITECIQVENNYYSLAQIEFIRILENIVKKQDLRPTNKKQSNTFQCDIGLNHNSIYQNCQAQDVSRCIKGEVSFQPQKDNNPVYSFNFTHEKGEAGLFFDISQDSISRTPTPQNFIGQLKSYQSYALTWMLFRQGIGQNGGMDITHVPYWTDYGRQLNLKQKLFVNKNLNFVIYKKDIQKRCNGGILADQMGLGKTIMIIALILAHRPSQLSKVSQTLIIAPLSVVKQWQDQIKKFAPSLKVYVSSQSQINKNRVCQSDVVITTQGKIKAEMKKQNSVFKLIQHQWFRIVIDEAHNFKNSKTAMAKAIYQLQAEYRWCLTGTPTQNSIGDLFSLVKFLRFTPWCWQSWWQSKFPKDVKKTKAEHFMMMKNLLKGILLRRRKQSIDTSGSQLVSLPKIDVKVHIVHLNQQAKLAYQLIDNRAQNTLKNLQKLENYLKNPRLSKAKRISYNQLKRLRFQQILGLMVKMRMICCHQLLVNYKSSFVSNQQFIGEYIKFLAKNKVVRAPKYNFFDYFTATAEQKRAFHKSAPISRLNQVYPNWDDRLRQIALGMKQQCLKCNELKQGVVTPCLHVFCRGCVQDYIQTKWAADNLNKRQQIQKSQFKDQKLQKVNLKDFQGDCPYCQEKLKIRQLMDLPRLNQFNTPLQQFRYSQKIIALLQYFKRMDINDKVLIYTSFLGMMKLIQLAFQRECITYLTVQGSDLYDVRHKKIQEFNENPRIKSLIITLKTGSVGLNLQSANWVFFMDPWWNPAIEDQAIGRVHRIGQNKKVQAIKFITQSTIEARILKLSLSKKIMSDSILDIDDVLNDKRFSSTRAQIKFLLSVQQQYDESDEQVQKEEGPEKMQEQNLAKSQNCKIKKQCNEIQERQREDLYTGNLQNQQNGQNKQDF